MLAGLADGVLRFLLVAAMICVAVRYLLPVVLTALVEPLCGVVGMLAALLVLPEFWISTAYRRNGDAPPHLAYLYGDGVCRLARIGHRGVRLVLRSLARAAHMVPPLAVALVVVAWQLVRILPL
jgi:hypothetical protein